MKLPIFKGGIALVALAVSATSVMAQATDGAVNPVLVSVTLGADSIVGSYKTDATVKLDRAAPGGGTVVAIASDSAKMIVPASTTVQAGKRNKTFNVLTASVLTDTVCTITASYDGVDKTDSLTVQPGGLSDMLCDPEIAENDAGQGQAWLTAITPTNVDIELRSSNSAVASVPATCTVPASDRFSNMFAITTGDVAVDTFVTIRARLGTSIRTETVNVRIPAVALTIHVLKSNLSVRNGASVTAHYFDASSEVKVTDINGDAIFTSPVAGAGTFDVDPPGAGLFNGNPMVVDDFDPTYIIFTES